MKYLFEKSNHRIRIWVKSAPSDEAVERGGSGRTVVVPQIGIEVLGLWGPLPYGMAKVKVVRAEAGSPVRGAGVRPMGDGTRWPHSILEDSLSQHEPYHVHNGLVEPFDAALRVGLVKGLQDASLADLDFVLLDAAYDDVGSSVAHFLSIGFAIAHMTAMVISDPHISRVSLTDSLTPFRKFTERTAVVLSGKPEGKSFQEHYEDE